MPYTYYTHYYQKIHEGLQYLTYSEDSEARTEKPSISWGSHLIRLGSITLIVTGTITLITGIILSNMAIAFAGMGLGGIGYAVLVFHNRRNENNAMEAVLQHIDDKAKQIKKQLDERDLALHQKSELEKSLSMARAKNEQDGIEISELKEKVKKFELENDKLLNKSNNIGTSVLDLTKLEKTLQKDEDKLNTLERHLIDDTKNFLIQQENAILAREYSREYFIENKDWIKSNNERLLKLKENLHKLENQKLTDTV